LELRAAITRKLEQVGRSSMSKSSNSGSVPTETSCMITTIGQLMRLTPPALLRALDPLLTNDECLSMVKRICIICSPEPKTAMHLLSKLQNQFIPSDTKALDKCLRGGFRVGTITEIVGKAGVGKTQLAMQLCIVATRLGYGSVFIDTEKKLSLQRLHEIARERFKLNTLTPTATRNNEGGMEFEDSLRIDNNSNSIQGQEICKYSDPAEVMNNVIVHSPTSTDELLSVVSQLDEEIIIRSESSVSCDSQSDAQLPIKMIILDSIAAPTRIDFGGGSAPQRVAAIFQLAQNLKRIADQMQVAVVVINQIDSGGYGAPGDQSLNGEVGSVKAALGTSWHHCVSTRIALEHYHDPQNRHVLEPSRVRTASVVKSNLVGRARMLYEVTTMGICDVNS